MEKQIPFGNDRQKGKGDCKSRFPSGKTDGKAKARTGRDLWYPTLAAVRLRQGWGTLSFGGFPGKASLWSGAVVVRLWTVGLRFWTGWIGFRLGILC